MEGVVEEEVAYVGSSGISAGEGVKEERIGHGM